MSCNENTNCEGEDLFTQAVCFFLTVELFGVVFEMNISSNRCAGTTATEPGAGESPAAAAAGPGCQAQTAAGADRRTDQT